ncbi:MAG: TetR/AcrR family transcriptional regulator [Pseudomonadota bacterium]
MEPGVDRDDQRQRISDAVRAVFLASGYAGASLTRLAAATGLGKASLYHYYPGGKAEMARSLVRDAIFALQREVFGPLTRGGSGTQRLSDCIDGFVAYTAGGQQNCIIALFLAEHAPVLDERLIHSQFEDWCRALADCYESLGQKPKAALRSARRLLGALYGALALAQLLGEPKELRRTAKRLKLELRDSA